MALYESRMTRVNVLAREFWQFHGVSVKSNQVPPVRPAYGCRSGSTSYECGVVAATRYPTMTEMRANASAERLSRTLRPTGSSC